MGGFSSLLGTTLGGYSLSKILSALVTLLVCLIAVRLIMKITTRLVDRMQKVNDRLQKLILTAVKTLLYILTVIITAEALGNRVTRLYDVGVAGLHRLLSNLEPLMSARVVIAVAGMEGALASVVGGLVDCPVIAVPTSVGYGASFGGVSALLSMLNSCASGTSVVNIDNGFGAGFLASRINQMESAKE